MNDRECTQLSEDLADDPFAGSAYRTIRPLGEGGMGTVLEIEHLALGKRLVAKVLKPELKGDANLSDRFRFEAQALSKISHPNLVLVLDLGHLRDGRPYFVMEKLNGRTLGQELRARGFLPIAEAIEITTSVLAGLGAAHAYGLVHRDVKLDNVFLCNAEPAPDARGRSAARRVVKVLDFGVAKAPRRGALLAPPPAHPTEKGALVGTPRYIAPEQIRGSKIDGRADLYATGLLLYTLLAGRSPFAGLKGIDLLEAHLGQAPDPPSKRAPQPIPEMLNTAILRALAKDPDDRYPTAAAFANELLDVLSCLDPKSPVERSRASVTPRGTQRIIPLPDIAALRAAHNARSLHTAIRDKAPANDQRPNEDETPYIQLVSMKRQALNSPRTKHPLGLRELFALIALLVVSAVVFWALTLAGSRLVG